MNLKIFYIDRADALAGEIAALKRKNRGFVSGEIIFFLAMIAFAVLYTCLLYTSDAADEL